jgi:acyl carrier protein
VTREDIVDRIRGLVEHQTGHAIASADDELDLDSFVMMLVISFVHDELDVQLDLERVDFDSFKSLNVIADLVIQQSQTDGSLQ